ncbi:MAG: tetratricopeptide repeat protein [Rhodomicrobium sp.]|nr:tetratricopeptide repeat protein [Rhodomicrobium sp.]
MSALVLVPVVVSAASCTAAPSAGEMKANAALSEAATAVKTPDGTVSTNNLLRLGKEIEGKGSVVTALPLYEKAAADPNAGAEVHVALGDAYTKLNRDGEAADAYRKALVKSPNDSYALFGLGSMLIRSGQVSTGLDMLLKAVPRVNTPEAYDRLGVAYIMAGQPREALASFEQAYGMNRNDPDIASNVALAAALLGQDARAVSLAQHTLTYTDIKPYHRRNLILALAISGKPETARSSSSGFFESDDLDALLGRAEQIRKLSNPRERAIALGTIRLAIASERR